MDTHPIARGFIIATILVFVFVMGILATFLVTETAVDLSDISLSLPNRLFSRSKEVKRFSSADDFREYLAAGSEFSSAMMSRAGGAVAMTDMALAPQAELFDAKNAQFGLDEAAGLGSADPSRVSDTNVQVASIDEPDIVKTDGKEIYFSSSYYGPVFRGPIMEERMIAPDQRYGSTKVVGAFPPADLKLDGEIDISGDLLLNDNKLIVLGNRSITGYDVESPEDPRQIWETELSDNTSVVTARMYDDQIYLITRTGINMNEPCPIRPLTINDQAMVVSCSDIYHPTQIIPTDSTYTIMKINPETGSVISNVAFVGENGSMVVYMSTEAIYVSYYYPGDFVGYFANFLKQNDDLFPAWFTDKVNQLKGYDISDGSKLSELQVIMSRLYSSIDRDDRLVLENNL